MAEKLDVVILGLSITSSWGNGHATTYRGLIRELNRRGHRVRFLERDVPWYAAQRDLPDPPYCAVGIYHSLADLRERFGAEVRSADFVIVGSYVPECVALAEWVLGAASAPVAFYDIDTPVTLARLGRNDCDYLNRDLIRRFDLYLSFTGGPTLRRLEQEFGARRALPLYCAVDADEYHPTPAGPRWDLGYLGTYSDDRQPILRRLLLEPAERWPEGRFAVAGPQYPPEVIWAANVARIEHLPPGVHRDFYNAQRFTLNVTRSDMVRAGYSPSVRLFEAAACGCPIISDRWEGLGTFFELGREILTASEPDEVLRLLREMPEDERKAIGAAGRRRVLAAHTAAHRAAELERYMLAARAQPCPVLE